MPETDEQYEARQNFEVARDMILGILGVLDVDQAFVEAIQQVPGIFRTPRDTERMLAEVSMQRNDARLECDAARNLIARLRLPGCHNVITVSGLVGQVHCMEHGHGPGSRLAECRYTTAAQVVETVLENDHQQAQVAAVYGVPKGPAILDSEEGK